MEMKKGDGHGWNMMEIERRASLGVRKREREIVQHHAVTNCHLLN
jgi:hypothetical protein